MFWLFRLGSYRIDYAVSPKARMTNALFFSWLVRINDNIAQNFGQKVLVLCDNASVHKTESELRNLSHIDVPFLSKHTTAILKPLNLEIMASVKRTFQHLLN